LITLEGIRGGSCGRHCRCHGGAGRMKATLTATSARYERSWAIAFISFLAHTTDTRFLHTARGAQSEYLKCSGSLAAFSNLVIYTTHVVQVTPTQLHSIEEMVNVHS